MVNFIKNEEDFYSEFTKEQLMLQSTITGDKETSHQVSEMLIINQPFVEEHKAETKVSLI